MMYDDKRLTFDEDDLDQFGIGVWNAAIEAVIQKLKEDFVAPEVVIKIIREVKK